MAQYIVALLFATQCQEGIYCQYDCGNSGDDDAGPWRCAGGIGGGNFSQTVSNDYTHPFGA